MPHPQPVPSQRAWIVWIALLTSIAIYAGLGTVAPPPRPVAPDHAVTLLAAFLVIAAANLATIMPVFRRMIARAADDSADGDTIRLTALVVAWARVEAVGVLGLTLYFLTGEQSWLWLFLTAAAIAMVILAPRPALLGDGDHGRQPIDPS